LHNLVSVCTFAIAFEEKHINLEKIEANGP